MGMPSRLKLFELGGVGDGPLEWPTVVGRSTMELKVRIL